MKRSHETEHNVSYSVIKRAEAIFYEAFDAYKRRPETNTFEKMAAELGVTDKTVSNANKNPLASSGWMVLIMMAQLEEDKKRYA